MAIRNLSRAQLVKRIEGSKNMALRAREKTTRAVEVVTGTAIASGAAFGVAFLDFKSGGAEGVHLGPLPMPLLVAGAALGLGLSGMGGGASQHLLAVGSGALHAWAAKQGQLAAANSASA